MAEDSGQERTEEPTGKRLSDARQKGQVPRSRELSTVAVLVASAAAMMILGQRIIASMAEVMKNAFSFDRKAIFNPVEMVHHLLYALQTISFNLGTFLAVTVVVALMAPIMMGGWNFSVEAFAIKLDKMDPIKGLKRVFGPQGLIELAKAMLKFLLIGTIATLILWNLRDQLLTLGQQEVKVAMADLAHLVLWVFLAICCSLILIAAIDVPFQKWNHIRQLRMTRQEVKDESKDTEGNPEIKGRIRRLQMEISQQRMMQEVPSADVIITNPTHYAVALRYDQTSNGAPIVIAKGADLLAQQIRSVGENNDVPMLSAPPLTRAIYFSTELGQEIPSGLYIAVAQVLAFVFQLRRYQRHGGNKPHLNPEDLPIPDELKRD